MAKVSNRKTLQLAGSTLAKIKALTGDDVIQERELLVSTDTGELFLGLSNGAFKVIGSSILGTAAEKDDATPNSGAFFFDTTNGLLYIGNGTSWEFAAGFKVADATEDNVVVFDANGSIKDSGFAIDDSAATNKTLWSAEKITTAITDSINGLSWQAPIKSVVATLPDSPTKGDRYLVLEGETNNDQICTYDGSKWVTTTPVDGMAVFAEDTDTQYAYNGTEWVSITAGFTYNAGNGITQTNNTFAVKAKENSGIVVGADGVSIDLDETSVVLDSNHKVSVKVKADSGVSFGTDGLAANLDDTSVTLDSTKKISVKVKADSGISESADGLGVAIDGSSIVLDTDKKLSVNVKEKAGVVVGEDGMEVSTDGSSIVVNATTGKLEIQDIDLGVF